MMQKKFLKLNICKYKTFFSKKFLVFEDNSMWQKVKLYEKS